MEHGNQTRNVAQSVEKTSEIMSNTILAVIDKLAGKQSDVKLSFEDLTLDCGFLKTRLNGAITLDVVAAKEAEKTGK